MTALLAEIRQALETAAGQYGPVAGEQRNEWLALRQRLDKAAPAINNLLRAADDLELPDLSGSRTYGRLRALADALTQAEEALK